MLIKTSWFSLSVTSDTGVAAERPSSFSYSHRQEFIHEGEGSPVKPIQIGPQGEERVGLKQGVGTRAMREDINWRCGHSCGSQ